jgi:hypothetical protein
VLSAREVLGREGGSNSRPCSLPTCGECLLAPTLGRVIMSTTSSACSRRGEVPVAGSSTDDICLGDTDNPRTRPLPWLPGILPCLAEHPTLVRRPVEHV